MTDAEKQDAPANGEKFFRVSQTGGLAVVALITGGVFTRVQEVPARLDAAKVQLDNVEKTVDRLDDNMRGLERSFTKGTAEVTAVQERLRWFESRLETVEKKLDKSDK